MSRIKEALFEQLSAEQSFMEYDTPLVNLVKARVDDEIRWTEGQSMTQQYDSGDFYDQQMEKMFWHDRKPPEIKMSESLEKASTDIEKAVNPKHYQNVAAGKQYIELMVDMLRDKTGVEAHLFGQVYKYLMRCGGKDKEIQELEKAKWYLTALIKYKTEGKVI